MSRDIQDNLATMAKANFGLQFVRWSSGQISLIQFLSYAILRPIKFAVIGFFSLAFIIILPIEIYVWYHEHTSFTYHLIRGDLDSISGNNSRTRKLSNALKDAEAAKAMNSKPVAASPTEQKVPARIGTHTNQSPDTALPAEPVIDNASTKSANPDIDKELKDQLKVADAELNNVYKGVIWSLPFEEANNLRIDERLWIKQRDQECSSFVGQVRLSCLISHTDSRKKYLESLIPNN